MLPLESQRLAQSQSGVEHEWYELSQELSASVVRQHFGKHFVCDDELAVSFAREQSNLGYISNQSPFVCQPQNSPKRSQICVLSRRGKIPFTFFVDEMLDVRRLDSVQRYLRKR